MSKAKLLILFLQSIAIGLIMLGTFFIILYYNAPDQIHFFLVIAGLSLFIINMILAYLILGKNNGTLKNSKDILTGIINTIFPL